MPELCPHCQQPIRKPRARSTGVDPVDTSAMSDTELFKHYKRTDRLETLRFWIANTDAYPAIQLALKAFCRFTVDVPIPPAEFDRRFNAIKADWRRESNRREYQAHIDAGEFLISEQWIRREDVVIVPVVFEDSERIEGAA